MSGPWFRVLLLALAIAVLGALVAIAFSHRRTPRTTDDIRTTPAVAPQRIVVANTTIVDFVADLTTPDRVAALCSQAFTWSKIAMAPGPWSSRPTFKTFTSETIAAHHPDLVLCSPFSQPETVQTLRAYGIDVMLVADPSTLDDVCENLRNVGRRLDATATAEAVVARLHQRIAALPAPPTGVRSGAYYTHSGLEGWTSATNTMADLALRLVGLDNAAARGDRHGPRRIDFEQLLAMDPDVLIVPAGFGEEPGTTDRRLRNDPMLAQLSAVRHRRIILLHPALFATTSHEVVTAAEHIAARLAGFGD